MLSSFGTETKVNISQGLLDLKRGKIFLNGLLILLPGPGWNSWQCRRCCNTNDLKATSRRMFQKKSMGGIFFPVSWWINFVFSAQEQAVGKVDNGHNDFGDDAGVKEDQQQDKSKRLKLCITACRLRRQNPHQDFGAVQRGNR